MPRTGRPTDYEADLGERVIALMTTGLSLTAAAAELGLHRQRLYDWAGTHDDFADAIKLAKGKRLLFLERRLLSAANSAEVTSSIFALKNADPEEWRDKHEVDSKVSTDDAIGALFESIALNGRRIFDKPDTIGHA